jgi:quercetin dioxygenase-like cupin family protein
VALANFHQTTFNKIRPNLYEMEKNKDLENGKAHIITEIIEYVPNAIVSRTLIKKTTGNIIATSMAIGEELWEKRIAFDTYVQIIDGSTEVILNNRNISLKSGEAVIIPAHATHSFTANEQFKMITTVIKSGYED